VSESREAETDLAVRAAWLSYVGGFTQEQIARRLGVSRVKVHRLSSLAHSLGLVKVSIEHEISSMVALENEVVLRYGLDCCTLVPTMEEAGSGSATRAAIGAAGARYLARYLERHGRAIIGVGWGRTLSTLADQLPRSAQPHNLFVSVIGSLTRHASANPYDVIHRLTRRTGAEGFIMPVPFIADTVEDRSVLISQKSVRTIIDLARRADLYLLGVGECGPSSHLLGSSQITARELADLRGAGAVGDLLGRFFDRRGRVVECDLNQRTLGLDPDDLRGRRVIALAGGKDKLAALEGALATGLVTGLITDEATAHRLLDLAPASAA
jgi:DNA-binding transcriptional regulator LsrR (DeoR family)